MNEIRCPHCGKVFQVDESGYEALVRQVRDEQFAADLHERVEAAAREQAQALELERASAANERQQLVAERDAKIAELSARVEALADERELVEQRAAAEARRAADAELAEQKRTADAALAEARRAADAALAEQKRASERDAAALQRQVDQLQVKLESQADAVKLAQADAEAAQREELAARDAQIAALSAQVASAAREQELAVDAARAQSERELSAAAAQAKAELTEAVTAAERERDQVRAELASAQAQAASKEEQLKSAHELELAQARAASEELIRYKDQEIERLRDMKARLSTKMVGETLEQHCETQFNQLRMTAFPHAYFEKDNDASAGTKGDYIFRECDETGTEIVSIMFEMKNENDETAAKHKNEDFFRKLDHDRTVKGCEYAVLVTLLEPESELYNTGIVDVSWRYPKMYVIRPQFFIPLITLLRNAAMNALSYKQQLAAARQQNLDVTHFEEKWTAVQTDFEKHYASATKNFNEAINEIDKAIARLNTVKQKLLTTDNQLRLANKDVQGATIRKLTWGNPTMKEAFAEARAVREAAAEAASGDAEGADGGDGDFEEPEYEVPEDEGE